LANKDFEYYIEGNCIKMQVIMELSTQFASSLKKQEQLSKDNLFKIIEATIKPQNMITYNEFIIEGINIFQTELSDMAEKWAKEKQQQYKYTKEFLCGIPKLIDICNKIKQA